MTEQIKPKTKQKLSTETSIPSFIKKIYEILEGRKFPDIIDWSTDGTALIIKSPMEFCHKVLPLYFKHNNLTSFIRQLNMYNFRKRRTQEMDHIYCHELFQKGKRHLLKEIKRKNHDPIRFMQKTMDSLDATLESQTDNSNVIQENHLLKSLNKDALIRIGTVEKKCKNLTSQNQALWHKVCGQHEREELLKGLLMTLMKHFGVAMNQLPMLMKSYPHLFLSSSKPDKDEFFKELSLDFPNLLKEKPMSNSLDFSGPNLDAPDLKSLLQMAPKPINFLDIKLLEESRDQIQASLAMFKNAHANLNFFARDHDMLLPPNLFPATFRPDFLKGFSMNPFQNNSMLNEKKELLDAGLLAKRPFNYEIDDQHSLDSNCTGNSSESGQNEEWAVKEEASNPVSCRIGSKQIKLKQVKKEECEPNLKIEIADFS